MNWPVIGFCLTVFILGLATGNWLTRIEMREAALKANCAQYDPQTGDFTWLAKSPDQ